MSCICPLGVAHEGEGNSYFRVSSWASVLEFSHQQVPSIVGWEGYAWISLWIGGHIHGDKYSCCHVSLRFFHVVKPLRVRVCSWFHCTCFLNIILLRKVVRFSSPWGFPGIKCCVSCALLFLTRSYMLNSLCKCFMVKFMHWTNGYNKKFNMV